MGHRPNIEHRKWITNRNLELHNSSPSFKITAVSCSSECRVHIAYTSIDRWKFSYPNYCMYMAPKMRMERGNHQKKASSFSFTITLEFPPLKFLFACTMHLPNDLSFMILTPSLPGKASSPDHALSRERESVPGEISFAVQNHVLSADRRGIDCF